MSTMNAFFEIPALPLPFFYYCHPQTKHHRPGSMKKSRFSDVSTCNFSGSDVVARMVEVGIVTGQEKWTSYAEGQIGLWLDRDFIHVLFDFIEGPNKIVKGPWVNALYQA
jgi:hypothetical protein